MASSSNAAALQAYLQGPALRPPPGVTPNFDNPYTLFDTDTAVMTICLAIPAVAIALRLYYKHVVLKDMGLDDWTLALGFAVYIPYSAITTVEFRYGLGRHQWDVRMVDMQAFLYYMRLETCLYCVCITLMKVSILLQYLKFFSHRTKRGFMFWGCWGLIAFLSLFYTAGLLVAIFPCAPIRKWWTVTKIEGYCINFGAAYLISGVVNTLSDLIIIALPQKSIWSLKMPRKKKLKVSIIFLVALFALVASVMRLVYCFKIKTSADMTWYGCVLRLWTYGELMTMMLCSCMPSLVGLVSHWGVKVSSSYWGSRALATFKFGSTNTDSQRDRTPSQEDNLKADIGASSYKHNYQGYIIEKTASSVSADTNRRDYANSMQSIHRLTTE